MNISAINSTSNFKQTICRELKDGIKMIEEPIRLKNGTDVCLITYYNKKGLLVACNELAQNIVEKLAKKGKIARDEADRRLSDLIKERIEIDKMRGAEIFCQTKA